MNCSVHLCVRTLTAGSASNKVCRSKVSHSVGTHKWSHSMWISKWSLNRTQCPRIPHSSHHSAKFSFELQLVRLTDPLWSDNSSPFLVLPLLLCTIKNSKIFQPLLAVMVNLVVVIKLMVTLYNNNRRMLNKT